MGNQKMIEFGVFRQPRQLYAPLKIASTSTKSGYLAIVGIENSQLKESNDKVEAQGEYGK
jgi:hypothetical protein